MKKLRVILFGRDSDKISRLVRASGFVLVKSSPDFVVSYGGDGTLMQAEHKFPGIPKVILRNSLICKLCSPVNNEEILKRVIGDHFEIKDLVKLEVRAGTRRLTAINDVIVHNEDPRHAIRYHLRINDKPVGGVIIGDGVVIATPFGSTGYYRSITDSFFELGMGVAFNNSTEQSDHVVIGEASRIKIKIARGPAIVFADNQERSIKLETDHEAVITASSQRFKFVNVLP